MTNEWKINYDKKDILGRGNYGIVYKGKLVNLNNDSVFFDVAIKRLVSAMLAKPSSVERELEQRKLDHPNVVKLLHDEEDEDFKYFALELCTASLNQVFLPENDPKKYRGPLPNEVDFMLQLSLGLEYIHSKNIVHRDIKPENALISSSNGKASMKWADFGLCKSTKKHGEFSVSEFKGTRHYWAPEIFTLEKEIKHKLTNDANDDAVQQTEMTIKGDIFACACVFFKFITMGFHPFGTNDYEIINNLQSSNPVNLEMLESDHFAFYTVKKMLTTQVEERLSLREVIPLFTSLQKITKETNQLDFIDAAYHDIKKNKNELHDLCSMADLNNNQFERLTQILEEDSIGLVNIVDENGHSPLLLLCQNNQSASLFLLIKMLLTKTKRNSQKKPFLTKIDVNYIDRKGFNALHYVCMNYHEDNLFEIINHLTRHGIDVNRTDYELNRNALQLFFQHNKNNERGITLKIVRCMIKNGIDMKHKHKNGMTSLHYLCRYYTNDNLVNVAQFLIENGVPVKEKDSDGFTALHWLGMMDADLLFQKCFTKKTFDTDVLTGDELGILDDFSYGCYITRGGIYDMIRCLVENGAEINAKTTNGFTILHLLCFNCYTRNDLIEIITYLIENGIEINAKDENDRTALHLLCSSFPVKDNVIDLIRLFIKNGADINSTFPHLFSTICNGRMKNVVGIRVASGWHSEWTYYHSLCRNYSYNDLDDIIQLLVENGADINAKMTSGPRVPHFMVENEADDKVKAANSDGWTPLHFYVSSGIVTELIRFLIDEGADINAKTSDGRTALHFLCSLSYYSVMNDNFFYVIRLLIEKGADVKAKDNIGLTPLDGLYGRLHSPKHCILPNAGDDLQSIFDPNSLERNVSKRVEKPIHLIIARFNKWIVYPFENFLIEMSFQIFRFFPKIFVVQVVIYVFSLTVLLTLLGHPYDTSYILVPAILLPSMIQLIIFLTLLMFIMFCHVRWVHGL